MSCFPLSFHIFPSPLWLGSLWQKDCVARGALTGNCEGWAWCTDQSIPVQDFGQSWGLHIAAGTCLWLLWRGNLSLPGLPIFRTCPQFSGVLPHRFLPECASVFWPSYIMSFLTPFLLFLCSNISVLSPLGQTAFSFRSWRASRGGKKPYCFFLAFFFFFFPPNRKHLLSPSHLSKAGPVFATFILSLASLSLFSSVRCSVRVCRYTASNPTTGTIA